MSVGLTDICKLPIFKDQEVMFLAEFLEALDHGRLEVLNDVYMSLTKKNRS